ncbi:hypothetical protein [Cystobacter ferrugineus]|uniref:DUF2076 domain-containing protein n=1 Tax=Cystobacter ferrugineus TaxID=83449 RepID=A0A1L9AU39_9BACT|nr:hypothetical protein [Cystobacter ferrugineus]OJH33502.1 hypothetical protein BON30_48405 [Cystobacter ferrugineus]
MGLMDRIFGRGSSPSVPSARPAAASAGSADDQALARYRYLLRTAPPEALEQAHAEAFAQLTPEQRTRALRELSQQLPESERGLASQDADPRALARMATRAELRQPGFMERTFGGGGFGSMLAGTLLGSIIGNFIGTAIAHQFLGGFEGTEPGDFDAAQADASGLEEDAGGFDDSGFDDAGGGFDGDSLDL